VVLIAFEQLSCHPTLSGAAGALVVVICGSLAADAVAMPMVAGTEAEVYKDDTAIMTVRPRLCHDRLKCVFMMM
jgi:hypothetical protein